MINYQGSKIDTVAGVKPASMRKFLSFTFREHFVDLKLDYRTFIAFMSNEADKEEAARFRKAFGNTIKFKYLTDGKAA